MASCACRTCTHVLIQGLVLDALDGLLCLSRLSSGLLQVIFVVHVYLIATLGVSGSLFGQLRLRMTTRDLGSCYSCRWLFNWYYYS